MASMRTRDMPRPPICVCPQPDTAHGQGPATSALSKAMGFTLVVISASVLNLRNMEGLNTCTCTLENTNPRDVVQHKPGNVCSYLEKHNVIAKVTVVVVLMWV